MFDSIIRNIIPLTIAFAILGACLIMLGRYITMPKPAAGRIKNFHEDDRGVIFAKLTTGVFVQVPSFLEHGDVVYYDANTYEYLGHL